MDYFIFSEMVRTADNAAVRDDNPRLGYYELKTNGTVSARYWIYSSRANFDPTPTPYSQPVHFSNPQNAPARIEIPTYSQVATPTGTWQESGGTLNVTLGTQTHVWVRQPKGHYEVANTWAGVWCRGFGYKADRTSIPHSLSWNHFYDRYGYGDGWNAENRPTDPLCTPKELVRHDGILKLQDFKATADPNIWGYYKSPPPSKPCGDFNTLLLNYASHSKLIVYNNNGLDFDQDKVFDEHNHTYKYYCVWDEAASKVKAIVYIQCFHQGPPGVQMCSSNPAFPNWAIVGLGHYQHHV